MLPPTCHVTGHRSEGALPLGSHQAQMSQLPSPPCAPSQDQVFQFCCRDCCEDFKRLRGVVSQCEHCRQEKLLHEKLRFSGVEKSFCSEGKRMGKGPRALDLTAGDSGPERRAWPAVHGARGLACSTPSALRLWAREALQERFQMCHLGGLGSHSHGDPVSLHSLQAACCCTSRTSLRSWDFAVSPVLTAPRPASAVSPSNWTAAPGTSAVRTVRASTCCGTAR